MYRKVRKLTSYKSIRDLTWLLTAQIPGFTGAIPKRTYCWRRNNRPRCT